MSVAVRRSPHLASAARHLQVPSTPQK